MNITLEISATLRRWLRNLLHEVQDYKTRLLLVACHQLVMEKTAKEWPPCHFHKREKKGIPTQNWDQRAMQNHFRDQPRQGAPANTALTLKPTLTLIGPAAGPQFSRHLRRSSHSHSRLSALPPFANVPAYIAPAVDFGQDWQQKVTTCACCEPHALGKLLGMRSSGWNHLREDAG